ncbi:MAG: glycosyltransferase family 2 protein, partial [Acidobacteriota bacterium]
NLFAENPKIGLLGVRLLNEDQSLQTSCFAYPTLWKNLVGALDLYRFYSPERNAEIFADEFFDHAHARKVDWVKGAFMLVKREAIQKAGAIPEDYFMFAEDLDWCWQIARNGYEIWYYPAVSILHKENKSAGQLPSNWRIERTTLSKYLFCFKNLGWLPTRIIQLSDFVGMSYKIIRVGKKLSKASDVKEWKIARWYVLKSIAMSRQRIQTELQKP